MILQKYTSMEIGRALMVSDLGIVAVAALLYGPRTGMYCILGMVLKCTVVDGAIENLNLRKLDPKAFLTIVNSSEIIGKGFRSI